MYVFHGMQLSFCAKWNVTIAVLTVKKNQSPYRAEVPRGFQEVKTPRFRDNGTGWWWVVSLTHRPPLPPGNAPGTHFCQRLSRPLDHSAIGGILYQ